jgi:hypothetical protein
MVKLIQGINDLASQKPKLLQRMRSLLIFLKAGSG